MQKNILCMGSINIDLTMYMDKLPTPGETIVTDNFQTFPGGKGGNQAAAAASLGGNVRYFTKLGDDAFSTELTEQQISRGVDMSHVIYEKGQTAGIAMIRVDGSGQNSISFTPGANSLLTPEDVRNHRNVFDGCDILLITMEIAENTVYEAIKTAKEKNMIVVLDPAPAPANGIPDSIASLVDYVKPNETEAETLTGVKVESIEDAGKALDILLKKGFKMPVITLSKDGALTVNGNERYYIKPYKVNSIDSTAAGDIFLGAFTAALSEDKDFKYCVSFAKIAAAISTERKGAQSSIPEYEEVIGKLKE